MKKSKETIIAAVGTLLAVLAVFIIATAGIKGNKEFKVNYFSEVKSEVGSDGRAAVGSPAVFQVRISPALAWQKGDNGVATWRVVAIILLIAASVYVGLSATGLINGSIHWCFVGFASALVAYYGAYSSAFSNNYKELSAKEYSIVKDDPKALEALFDKPLIK